MQCDMGVLVPIPRLPGCVLWESDYLDCCSTAAAYTVVDWHRYVTRQEEDRSGKTLRRSPISSWKFSRTDCNNVTGALCLATINSASVGTFLWGPLLANRKCSDDLSSVAATGCVGNAIGCISAP